jgi:hypothetical protein
MGGASNVNGDLQFFGEHVKSSNVVAVLMRYQDGVDTARIFPAQLHAAHDFAARKPGVDQQASSGARDQRAIPAASTRQHRNRNRHKREHNRKASRGDSDKLINCGL